jgi:hypothetical protein
MTYPDRFLVLKYAQIMLHNLCYGGFESFFTFIKKSLICRSILAADSNKPKCDTYHLYMKDLFHS